MIDLEELRQLTMFAREGTLSKAAEKLHISQPTLSRTMQNLEEVFGVSLFVRGKNKIEFNETGWKAAERAEHLLAEAEDVLRQVREFDKRLHTITVESCAPAPLWSLLPALSGRFPGMTISSSLEEVAQIGAHVARESVRWEFCRRLSAWRASAAFPSFGRSCMSASRRIMSWQAVNQ